MTVTYSSLCRNHSFFFFFWPKCFGLLSHLNTIIICIDASQVVVSAVLYLRLSKTDGSEDQTLDAMRLLNLHEGKQRNPEENASVHLLLETGGDLHDCIFMAPLHLRIRLECEDHPPATTKKEIILTDTSLEVNVSLDWRGLPYSLLGGRIEREKIIHHICFQTWVLYCVAVHVIEQFFLRHFGALHIFYDREGFPTCWWLSLEMYHLRFQGSIIFVIIVRKK